MKTTEQRRGFTIIEVVLVLAIAGLIFLVVFLALPALQKSQRDTQRKSDLGRLMSQLSNYQSNNQGRVPGPGVPTAGMTGQQSVDDFVSRYLTISGESFADPSTGSNYNVSYQATVPNGVPNLAIGEIYYYINAGCSGESVVTRSGARNVAGAVKLERGSVLCQQN